MDDHEAQLRARALNVMMKARQFADFRGTDMQTELNAAVERTDDPDCDLPTVMALFDNGKITPLTLARRLQNEQNDMLLVMEGVKLKQAMMEAIMEQVDGPLRAMMAVGEVLKNAMREVK